MESGAALDLQHTGASGREWKLVSTSVANTITEGYFGIKDETANSWRMVINDTGNVGIGTTSPSSKLEVSGGDIRVTGGSFIDDGTSLNTPDYVFEKGYRLIPLNELREFINREGHLPNVPNSDEIKENGLNISKFQMRLLEKIEELTLYTLAQQKKIEVLEARLNERQ